MSNRSSRVRGSLLAALMVGLMAMPEADAKGSRGGHHAARAPRVSSAHRSNKAPAHKAPKMPRAAPRRGATSRTPTMPGSTRTTCRPTPTTGRPTRTTLKLTRTTGRPAPITATSAGTANPARTSQNTALTSSATHSPYSYTYGSGSNARNYRAYGLRSRLPQPLQQERLRLRLRQVPE